MPRTARRLSPVRGRAVRATRLDNCGRVVIGEYNQAVSEGIVTVAFTALTTETAEINTPNFNGKRCVYVPAEPELAGYSTVITFCNVDYEMFEIISKQTLVFDANGDVVGIEANTKIPLTGEGFALEVWTGTVGADACEDPNAEGEYGYLLLPLLKGGVIGDFTVENGALNFTITGATTRDGNNWGTGPYAVEMDELGVAGPLFQAVDRNAPLRIQTVTVAPPLESTGSRPVLDPTKPDLTSATATEGTDPLEVDFTTTPGATGPVWWEFGDGTWDYVAAPGATSHVYPANATYTARATQNGVDWAEVTVTLPFP